MKKMKVFKHYPTHRGELYTNFENLLGSICGELITSDRFESASKLIPSCAFEGVFREPLELGPANCVRYIPAHAPSAKAVLYLHGGAFKAGRSTLDYEAARLASSLMMQVIAVDYRLSYEEKFPAALDDATAAYNMITRFVAEPEGIALVGDSAGGGLTLSLALRLRDNGDTLPAVMCLVSPWADLSCSGKSFEFADDRVLTKSMLLRDAHNYAGERPLDSPLISPMFADLTGLPPALVIAGTKEVLLSDAVELSKKLTEAGNGNELHIWYGMSHDFPFIFPMLSESCAARALMNRWIQYGLELD